MLVISGTGYEQIGRYRDRHRHEQIGKSVDIGGRTLNIFCSGNGGPAVVFDTFGHMSGYSWSRVQLEVAKYTRACWYDRAGYGWSEPGPAPRTFQAVASDLQVLLNKAGVAGPFVLVGAGDAALHIRAYHGKFPGDVAGVVMVNANDVDDARVAIPESAKGAFAKHFGSWAPRVRRVACEMAPLFARVGIARFVSLFGRPRRTDSFGLTAQEQARLDDLSDNPTALQASELCAREESLEQVRAAGDLGVVPLLVLASDASRLPAESDGSDEARWKRHRVEQVPRALASLSSRGRLLVVDGDLTEDAVVRAILDILAIASDRK
jgi:hypothetical protein